MIIEPVLPYLRHSSKSKLPVSSKNNLPQKSPSFEGHQRSRRRGLRNEALTAISPAIRAYEVELGEVRGVILPGSDPGYERCVRGHSSQRRASRKSSFR